MLSCDDEIWIFSECLRLSNLLTERKHSRQTQAYWASFNCPKRDLYIGRLRDIERDMRDWTVEQVRQSQVDTEEDNHHRETFLDSHEYNLVVGQENARRKGASGPVLADDRWHRIPLTRLSGGRRKKIIELVAKKATKRFGRPISPHRVRAVWESENAALNPSFAAVRARRP